MLDTFVKIVQDTGFDTLPDLIHLVHTLIRLVWPLTATRTRWRFGIHRLRVWLLAWLTLQPVTGPLPHISHTLDILSYPLKSVLIVFVTEWHFLQCDACSGFSHSAEKAADKDFIPFFGVWNQKQRKKRQFHISGWKSLFITRGNIYCKVTERWKGIFMTSTRFNSPLKRFRL